MTGICIRLLVAGVLAASAAPAAYAEFLPQPEEMMTAQEAKLFSQTVGPMLARAPDPSENALPVIDSLLAGLHEPTKFRGYVQFLRATILSDMDRDLEDRAAGGRRPIVGGEPSGGSA